MFDARTTHRAVALLLVLAVAVPAAACRYSVREVGFVDLDEAPYRFLIYPGNATEDIVSRVKRAAYTAFIDAHVLISEAEVSNPPVDYVERHRLTTFPAGVLIAPEGQSIPVDLSDAALQDDDALLARLHPLVSSPTRVTLKEKVIEPFCTLLLIHGDDEKLNVTTKIRIESAIDELTDNMDKLEKATEVPPQLVELSVADRGNEIPLLWSLGLSPIDLAQPRVAVLFGRARRMGSVLRGDRVSQDSLVEVMTLIGASCECGLDRKWMQGPMLLLDWDNTDQADLAKHLGFDPESPLVKTEISQIIAQGMAQGSASKMDSILGVDQAEGALAAADVEMEDVLVVEDVPLGSTETTIEDVPLSEDITAAIVDAVEAARPGDSHFTLLLDENGDEVSIHDPYITIANFNVVYIGIGIFILLNVGGAIYLYRKKSQQ